MEENGIPESAMVVVAHPDDAELLCAGTLARARADGGDLLAADASDRVRRPANGFGNGRPLGCGPGFSVTTLPFGREQE